MGAAAMSLASVAAATSRQRAWVIPFKATRRWPASAATSMGGVASRRSKPTLYSCSRSGKPSSNMGCPTWQDLGLSAKACAAVEQWWPRPNRVQQAAVGVVLTGVDTVLGAETGSGKTLAYLLPAMEVAANRDKERQYPSVLILVPNRELGTQLQRVARQLGGNTSHPFRDEDAPFSLGMRHGGATTSLWPYRRFECPDMLVATPSFAVNFDRDLELWAALKLVVLDEADALLDGGSKQQLDRILVAMKRVERARNPETPRCQRVVVAATLPTFGLKSVENLIGKHFGEAVRVTTADGDPLPMHAPVATLEQRFIRVDGGIEDKLQAALDIIVPNERTMIFANTVNAVDVAASFLLANRVRARAYHKRVSPEVRLDTLDAFAVGEIDVLCCTDLAARGLDLPDVRHVIQLEFATNVVAHLHRLGRVARAGNSGRATNIYDEASTDLLRAIDDGPSPGSVVKAFSRRRGFRQKIKKNRKRIAAGRDFSTISDSRSARQNDDGETDFESSLLP